MQNLDVKDVMKLLGCSEKTVRRYVADGTLHPTRDMGKLMFSMEDVEKAKVLLQSRRSASQTSPVRPAQAKSELSEVLSVLTDQLEVYKKQLDVKDSQMSELHDRLRASDERNQQLHILLKGLQDKLLPSPIKKDTVDSTVTSHGQTGTDRGDLTREVTKTVTMDNLRQSGHGDQAKSFSQKHLPSVRRLFGYKD